MDMDSRVKSARTGVTRPTFPESGLRSEVRGRRSNQKQKLRKRKAEIQRQS